MRPHKITAACVDRIVKLTRSGSYPTSAAEAAGIPISVFEEWLKRADEPRANRLYRELRDGVTKAGAEARCYAEARLLQDKPDLWVRYGPAKETQLKPGWSAPAKAIDRKEEFDPYSSPELMELLSSVNEFLLRFPEVHRAFVEWYTEQRLPKPKARRARTPREVQPSAPPAEGTPSQSPETERGLRLYVSPNDADQPPSANVPNRPSQ